MLIEKQKNKRAFSLVEVLIVLAIVAIMTAGMLVNVNKNKSNEELKNAAGEIVSILKGLQNDAVNGKLYTDGRSISQFSFVANTGSNQYQLAYTPSTGNAIAPVAFYITSKGASSVVKFTGATKTVSFSTPLGSTWFSDGTTSGTSGSLVLTDGSVSYYVCIGNGNIVAQLSATCP